MLDAYQRAASFYGLRIVTLESAAILPRALLSIAASAGLVSGYAEDRT